MNIKAHTERVTKHGTLHTILTPTFWSWDEFIRQVELPVLQPGNASDRNGKDDNYFGCASLPECLDLARYGWAHGRDKMAKWKGMLDNVITGGQFKPEALFAEAGDDVDVPRYLSGDPENMIEWHLRQYTGGKSGRIVKLLINVTSSASIENDWIYLRGATALAFIDCLERYGYRCELWCGEVGHQENCNHHIFLRTCLKPAAADYDIDRVAFALCHPDVQRRMFFRVYEQHPKSLWNVDEWAYGGGGTFNDPDPEVIEFGWLWHTAQGGYINTTEGAMKELTKTFTKFGIEIDLAA
jgi:hypothetical protein